jgi:hypothetical protein
MSNGVMKNKNGNRDFTAGDDDLVMDKKSHGNYPRDEGRVNAILFYAAINKVDFNIIQTDTVDSRFDCTINISSKFVDTNLTATFLCETEDTGIFEPDSPRVRVLTEIDEATKCDYYDMSGALLPILEFIDFLTSQVREACTIAELEKTNEEVR